MIINLVEQEILGNGKFKYTSNSNHKYFSKYPLVIPASYDVKVSTSPSGKSVITEAIPQELDVEPYKSAGSIKSNMDVPGGFAQRPTNTTEPSPNALLLESIWKSPALGTQPGNPDEILKIAKKWYEESNKWV